MRRLMTLGLISIGAACTVACGDDAPSFPGNGGSAGTNGNAGNAGNGGMPNGGNGGNAGTPNGGTGGNAGSPNGGTGGGTSGAGGDGGSAGDDGDGPDAGDGGGGPPCNGCVELRVPVTGPNQDTLFQFFLAAPLDMSSAVITYRVRALTLGNQLAATPFAQDADFGGFASAGFINLDVGNGFTSTDVFVDIVHDLSAVPPADIIGASDAGADGGGGAPDPADFDKSQVRQFGLIVSTGGAFTGTETITVLLDSVTFEGVDALVRPDVLFTADAEGFGINGFQPQPDSEVIHHP